MTNEPNNPVELMVKKAMSEVLSTSAGRAEIRRLGDKDTALTNFQKENAISDDIAEAAIKEWVVNHDGNFDWNLEQVQTNCVRIKKSQS